ncbi:transposase, partial [Clostridium tetani]
SRLCYIGVELISTEDKYKNLINKFILEHNNLKMAECT